jgi:hypothetical protein
MECQKLPRRSVHYVENRFKIILCVSEASTGVPLKDLAEFFWTGIHGFKTEIILYIIPAGGGVKVPKTITVVDMTFRNNHI